MIGENFPYTNFHDMNLDWIIKIAKDFLDQYTSLQTMISEGEASLTGLTEDGLQQLQDKADALEDALQAWYTEHSEDIAGELAAALQDLNDWYTLHENYLDATLTAKEAAFDEHADQKAAATIATIPDDYTELANKVTVLVSLTEDLNLLENATITGGYWNSTAMDNTSAASQNYVSTKITVDPGEYCLNFSTPVHFVRIIINNIFFSLSGYQVSDNGFVFYVPTRQEIGFSWRKTDASAWGAAEVYLMKGTKANSNTITDIDFVARNYSDYSPFRVIGREYFTNGYYDDATLHTGNTRICSLDRFEVHRGDIFLIPNGVAAAVFFYDKTDTFIESIGYCSRDYLSATGIQSSVVTCKHDGYIRFHYYVVGVSGNISPADNAYNFTIIRRELYNIKNYDGLVTSYKTKYMTGEVASQGMCVINGKIWTFDDSTIKIVDPETLTVTTKSHSLGHCNSVDYDPVSNCIMIYSSQGADKPVLYMYKDPENNDNYTENDENCTIVALYNVSTHMNTSASVCFAEGNMYAYYIEGIYKDSLNTIETNPKIYKLRLGMGDNDLSASGYGIYISGRTGSEYNGTVETVETYEGNIIAGLNAISSGNSLWTPQDSKFNGYLYISYGTCGSNVLVVRLHDGLFEVVNNIRTERFDFEGTVIPVEPEGMAFDENGTMYVTLIDRITHDCSLYQVVK